jgi:hypothetical protein
LNQVESNEKQKELDQDPEQKDQTIKKVVKFESEEEKEPV